MSRLKKKSMGDRNGLCPIEEVYHLSTVDPGAIIRLGCEEQNNAPVTEKGFDCFGNQIDIETKGTSGASVHCGSQYGGSITMGVDSFKPEFYSFETRMPTVCVDAAMTSSSEVKKNLMAIRQAGPGLVHDDLEWLMWDLMVERGTGNTAIANEVNFSQDVGLTGGKFPYKPQGRANHEFFKSIQDRVMSFPDNQGKKFYVEGSELQIARAINDHQEDQGIERRSVEKIIDPYRLGEKMYHYDGITYVYKEHPDHVGCVELTDGSFKIVRPRRYVHQAGTEYGLVQRPNQQLYEKSCQIECDGAVLDKLEVMHWYVEDAIYFVPFMGRKGKVPTSGKEMIKDHVYATPASFKHFYVAPHAVQTPDGCSNDRNQYQQMGMMTKFGLFHRPDLIQSGHVLVQPVERCITLRTGCNPEKDNTVPETRAGSFDHSGTVTGNTCGHGSCGDECLEKGTPIQAQGSRFVETPDPNGATCPAKLDEVPGEIAFAPGTYRVSECGEGLISICLDRLNGCLGQLQGTITSVDGTAVDGTNYTAIPANTQLTWADGETGRKCIEIPILEEDPAITEDKTFDVCFEIGGVKTIQTVTIRPCLDADDSLPNCESC